MTGAAISIVVAAYGRPEVLPFALRSVQAQAFEDWDLLVVGDAAGGETAEVVERIGDPRIRFVDLPVNIGEQSGPNNVGIARTTAPLIAFLNQDDLWFPDHLTVVHATLQARVADIAFSPNINIIPGSALPHPTVAVDGLARGGRYDPGHVDGSYPASTWLARRSAVEALGGWHSVQESGLVPSQDLLARAHRRRMRIWSSGVATVITLPAGIRSDSYVDGATDEHEWYAKRLDDPSLRPDLLARDERQSEAAASRRDERMSHLGRLWRRTAHLLPRVAPPPVLLHRRALRLGTDSAYIETLRARRGLPAALPAGDSPVEIRRAEVLRACTIDPGESVRVSLDGGGSRFLAAGWSSPENDFTWNDGHHAEIAVRRPDGATSEPVTLTLNLAGRVDADHPHQRVTLSVDGRTVATQTIEAGEVDIHVPLGDLGQRPRTIALDLPDAFADGPDPRVMAVRVQDLRLDRDS